MQRRIRPQRNLAPRRAPKPRHPNRHVLPRQAHRSGVAAVPASPSRRVLARVALAGQRRHLLVEQFLHMHQAQGHQGPDQLHLGVQLQLGVVLAAQDVDPPQLANLLALPDRT